MNETAQPEAVTNHIRKTIGETLWEGKPNLAPFLSDWMGVYLGISGTLLGFVALLSIGWWWGAMSEVETWDGAAIARAALGPISIAALSALAIGMPAQLFLANRKALRRLRYVIGDNGFSILMDEKSFSLPDDKIDSIRIHRKLLPTPSVSLEIATDADWKASGVYHLINESFSISRVADLPTLYYIPKETADRLIARSQA